MSRQVSGRYYYIMAGTKSLFHSDDFPASGWNKFEIATDDADQPPQPYDEDNVPATGKDHVYQIDCPSVDTSGDSDFIVLRVSFREFTRFKFGPNQSFVQPNFNVDGSLGSPLEPWHLLLYVRRDELPLGQAGTYKEDNANPSCSLGLPNGGNTGNGTCVGTPNAANAVTEGWAVVYNAGTDTWAVTGSDGSSGTLTKADATHWTGNASKGGNVRISITVTLVGAAFADADFFLFSTFKSTASDGKKYEIETGPCTITDGP